MAAVGAASSVASIIGGNKSAIKQYTAQMKAINRNYNYNSNQLTMQETQEYHKAQQSLFQLSWQAVQSNASVKASLAETGVEGRSSKQIERTVEGTSQMQSRAQKDQFEEFSANIKAQKESLYIQAKDQANSAKVDAKSQMKTSPLEILSEVTQGAMQGLSFGTSSAGGYLSSLIGGSSATGNR